MFFFLLPSWMFPNCSFCSQVECSPEFISTLGKLQNQLFLIFCVLSFPTGMKSNTDRKVITLAEESLLKSGKH